MLIRLHRSGDIRSATEPLREGLNVRGVIRGRIHPATLEVEPVSLEAAAWAEASDRDGAYTHGNAALWRVRSGRLVFAAPDLAGVHDVVYAGTEDGGWWVADDLFEIAGVCDSLELDAEAVAYFVAHGYFHGSSTFFRHIRRVPAGARWMPEAGRARIESLFETVMTEDRRAPRTSGQFRRVIESVCRAEAPGGRDAILLSGGWDSGLLAAQMRAVTSSTFHAVTYRYTPEKDANQTDVQVARDMSGHLGLRHSIVSMDLCELGASMLDPLVTRMPLAAPMAAIVLKGTESLRAAGIERVWCGQNADSIYNLGPTARLGRGQGKVDLIKRLYLSKPFFKTLADVEGRGVCVGATKAAAELGARLAALHYRGRRFRTPQNFNELLQAFRASENYLCLLAADSPSCPPLEKAIRPRDVRERLFDEKLSSFLVGRDPRVMHYGPLENGLDPVRPFASPALLLFFRSLDMEWRDILEPKRFIRESLRDLLGAEAFRRIYGARRAVPTGKKSLLWQSDLLQRARICREMLAEVQCLPAPWRDYASAGKLQYVTSLYWLSKVLKSAGAGAPGHG